MLNIKNSLRRIASYRVQRKMLVDEGIDNPNQYLAYKIDQVQELIDEEVRVLSLRTGRSRSFIFDKIRDAQYNDLFPESGDVCHHAKQSQERTHRNKQEVVQDTIELLSHGLA